MANQNRLCNFACGNSAAWHAGSSEGAFEDDKNWIELHFRITGLNASSGINLTESALAVGDNFATFFGLEDPALLDLEFPSDTGVYSACKSSSRWHLFTLSST